MEVCVKICCKKKNSPILKESNKRQETIACVLCVISIDNVQNIHPQTGLASQQFLLVGTLHIVLRYSPKAFLLTFLRTLGDLKNSAAGS